MAEFEDTSSNNNMLASACCCLEPHGRVIAQAAGAVTLCRWKAFGRRSEAEFKAAANMCSLPGVKICSRRLQAVFPQQSLFSIIF